MALKYIKYSLQRQFYSNSIDQRLPSISNNSLPANRSCFVYILIEGVINDYECPYVLYNFFSSNMFNYISGYI